MKLLLLTLLTMSAYFDEVLVLRNGKKILCDSYERVNGQVNVVRGDERFRLPEKMIDWERSKTATTSWREQQARKVSPKKTRPEKKQWQAKKPEGEISLNNRDYHKNRAQGSEARTVVIPFRKVGNSILVDGMLNDKKKVTFLLDTGASVTALSPSMLRDLNLVKTGSAMVTGVSGILERADVVRMDKIALGGASVEGLKITMKEIRRLNDMGVVGLLGQDYLNHFVMKLDPVAQKVTLEPHGPKSSSLNRVDQSLSNEPINPQAAMEDLNKVYADLLRYAETFFSAPANEDMSPERDRVIRLVSQLGRKRAEADKAWAWVKSQPKEHLTPKTQRTLGCIHHYERYKNEMDRFAKDLRRAYMGKRDSGSVRQNKSKLQESSQNLRKAAEPFQNCLS